VKTAGGFTKTFFTCLPTVWWFAQEIPSFFYDGWDHDPRFFNIYFVPAKFFIWVSEKTDGWWGQTYWVATQDAALGLCAAAIVARFLNRSDLWNGSPKLRAVTAVVGAVLPWYRLVESLDRPSYYALGAYSLAAAYCLAAVAGFLLPGNPRGRAIFLGLAIAVGGSLAVWRLEQWSWLLSGSLVGSLILLIGSEVSALRNEQVV
jgi:hypothetical protein